MKKKLILTMNMLLLGILIVQANGISGIWEVNRTGDIAIIEETADGIRAKLGEQGPWYYYEQVSKREFVDKRGNSYRVESNNQLSWTNRERSKSFTLVRLNKNDVRRGQYSSKPGYQGSGNGAYQGQQNNRYYSDDRGFNSWYTYENSRQNRAYVQQSFRERNRISRFMDGRWFNTFGQQVLRIRAESSTRITVKFKNSFHRRAVFRQSSVNPNVFVDRHGHKLVLTKWGELILDIPESGRLVLNKSRW